MVTDEDFDKLMAHVENLTKDVMGLRKREILTQSAFMVLKELSISRLMTERSLTQEEAEKVFHDSVEQKYEAKILQIGDYAPEFARAIDMHQNREDDWL